MDKTLIKERFERSFRKHSYTHAVIQPRMAGHLTRLLLQASPVRSYPNVLELGCGPRSMALQLLPHISTGNWTANDIAPVEDSFHETARMLGIKQHSFILGDMETIDLPGEQDLIVSNATIQWISEPALFTAGLVEKLAPGGMLAISTFGPDNLHEIKELTGLSLNYSSSSEYRSALASKGSLLCFREERTVMKFASPRDILRHLKRTGTNGLARRSWTRGDLVAFSRAYIDRFSENGGVMATYHPLYIVFQREG